MFTGFPLDNGISNLRMADNVNSGLLKWEFFSHSYGIRNSPVDFIPYLGFSVCMGTVFITAPNEVPPLSEAEEDGAKNTDSRGWWFSRQDDYFRAQDESTCVKGYDPSLDVIKQAFIEQGPFDGVLAFSQGAAMLSLVCGLREQDPVGSPYQFDFAILVAGFKSRSKGHDHLYEKPITVPSLHVYGDTDKVIEKVMSEDLLQYFVEPRTLTHSGGHFIPTSGPQKKIYQEFLDDMRARKTAKQPPNS